MTANILQMCFKCASDKCKNATHPCVANALKQQEQQENNNKSKTKIQQNNNKKNNHNN